MKKILGFAVSVVLCVSVASLSALLPSMIHVVRAEETQVSDVFYKSDSESVLALYAMVDVAVANEYLRPMGLEAVDIGGGKTLTGITLACFERIEFPTVNHSEKNYCYSSLPMLVTKAGTELQGAYLFSRSKINSQSAVAMNSQLGIKSAFADVFLGRSESAYPNGQQTGLVYLRACVEGEACELNQVDTRLTMGLSRPGELTSATTTTSNWQVADPTPAGNPANIFDVQGTLYTRAFDPARDSFYFAPGTPEAAILRHSSFTPTSWQIGNRMSVVGRNFKIFK